MAQYGAEQPLVRDFSHTRDTRKVADRFGGARFEAGHKITGGVVGGLTRLPRDMRVEYALNIKMMINVRIYA